jgi:hypothetical protein
MPYASDVPHDSNLHFRTVSTTIESWSTFNLPCVSLKDILLFFRDRWWLKIVSCLKEAGDARSFWYRIFFRDKFLHEPESRLVDSRENLYGHLFFRFLTTERIITGIMLAHWRVRYAIHCMYSHVTTKFFVLRRKFKKRLRKDEGNVIHQ